ncbi:MAG: hypothetical protein BMS9Abin13_619 [Patescibacteria group bacterium]|nr:MAG: hypothetical protein BMS9Abin13_619 [Patescibacteria group bacterium]
MRKVLFAPEEVYHLYGRGNDKQKLFLDKRDWIRFLFLILYLQSHLPLYHATSAVNNFKKNGKFGVSRKMRTKILESRGVELVSFVLMPNHFHLVVRELKEGGISEYMQKVLMAYAKYFNAKYKRSGHVFQGPFGATHVASNEQLLHLSAYIHRNPREMSEWRNKEHTYTWSSYQDCTGKNRWGELLKNDIIIEQFTDSNTYKKFVDTSGTKDF